MDLPKTRTCGKGMLTVRDRFDPTWQGATPWRVHRQDIEYIPQDDGDSSDADSESEYGPDRHYNWPHDLLSEDRDSDNDHFACQQRKLVCKEYRHNRRAEKEPLPVTSNFKSSLFLHLLTP